MRTQRYRILGGQRNEKMQKRGLLKVRKSKNIRKCGTEKRRNLEIYKTKKEERRKIQKQRNMELKKYRNNKMWENEIVQREGKQL